VETQIETQSKAPHVGCVLLLRATGSPERHCLPRLSLTPDAFTVDFEAAYESGDLTITVDRADDP